jgi:hypothetical protein
LMPHELSKMVSSHAAICPIYFGQEQKLPCSLCRFMCDCTARPQLLCS